MAEPPSEGSDRPGGPSAAYVRIGPESGGTGGTGGTGSARAPDGRGGRLSIEIGGELSAATLPAVWPQAVEPVRRLRPKQVVIDVSRLTYCDGACLGLFAEIR